MPAEIQNTIPWSSSPQAEELYRVNYHHQQQQQQQPPKNKNKK
jgi:hypothetical protein